MSLLIPMALQLVGITLLVPNLVLWVECMAALWPAGGQSAAGLPGAEEGGSQGRRPPAAVLIPAHNEAPGIAATIETILPQLHPQDRLIVVAHNCNDETVVVARHAGASVVEYQQPDQVGKGYALAYGLRFLTGAPPEVVVVVDADCQVEPGALDHLVRYAWTSGRPVQGSNCMKPPPDPRPRDLVSALAVLLKNFVRPLGLSRLGLPCLLTGTGMAFPWRLIHGAPIAGHKLAEDMQLTVDLTLAGTPPFFAHRLRSPVACRSGKPQRYSREHAGSTATWKLSGPRRRVYGRPPGSSGVSM